MSNEYFGRRNRKATGPIRPKKKPEQHSGSRETDHDEAASDPAFSVIILRILLGVVCVAVPGICVSIVLKSEIGDSSAVVQASSDPASFQDPPPTQKEATKTFEVNKDLVEKAANDSSPVKNISPVTELPPIPPHTQPTVQAAQSQAKASKIEYQDRKKQGEEGAKIPKIDQSKPFIYVIVRPGRYESRDFNRVTVTVQNGTNNRISVVTQVNSNIMGHLFVDSLNLNIPEHDYKKSKSSWEDNFMHPDLWAQRSYILSSDVTGAPNDVQMFYAVPDAEFGRFRLKRPAAAKLVPVSELQRQFGVE